MQREGVRHPLHLWYSTGTSLQCLCVSACVLSFDRLIGEMRKELVFTIFLDSIKS